MIGEKNKLKKDDKVKFEYYTGDDKCVTGSGIVLWFDNYDVCVQGKNKRHQMQISAITEIVTP